MRRLCIRRYRLRRPCARRRARRGRGTRQPRRRRGVRAGLPRDARGRPSRARRHRLALAFSRRRRVHRLRRSGRRRGRGGACARRRGGLGLRLRRRGVRRRQAMQERVPVLLHAPAARRHAPLAHAARRRLPAELSVRHLRHPHEPGIRGRGAHPGTAHLAPARVASRGRRPRAPPAHGQARRARAGRARPPAGRRHPGARAGGPRAR